ncbi:hypothetical protein FB446DRAFT_406354 [Lentinula raphanica]|nr:hypothetical protein FB446DRAFT_406354 [Lentinula raphanica]
MEMSDSRFSNPTPDKHHWPPMAKRFSPAQILNMYAVHYRLRIQHWNASCNWSIQILSFQDWFALVKEFDGDESQYEYWHFSSWLQAQGLDVASFLAPLLIPPGSLVTESGHRFCCYSGCSRGQLPFSSKQARDSHFYTQHCACENERRFCCAECLNVYRSMYALRRHERYAHSMPNSESRLGDSRRRSVLFRVVQWAPMIFSSYSSS